MSESKSGSPFFHKMPDKPPAPAAIFRGEGKRFSVRESILVTSPYSVLQNSYEQHRQECYYSKSYEILL